MNCIDVEGTNLRVNSVRAIRSEPGSLTMCNYKAKMTAVHNGSYVESARWSFGPAGCSIGSTAWVDFYPNRDYPNGTQICVYFYMNGTLTTGYPCATVKRDTPEEVVVDCDVVGVAAAFVESREPVLLAMESTLAQPQLRFKNCPPDVA